MDVVPNTLCACGLPVDPTDTADGYGDPMRCEACRDYDVARERYATLLADLVTHAQRSDDSADLAGAASVNRAALLDAFQDAVHNVRVLMEHQH